MKFFFKERILKHLVWWIYRGFMMSWRIRFHEPPALLELRKQNKAFILAHWHGDELGLLFLVRRYGLATMTSTSKDGELMDFILRKLNGYTSRGSSTRGAVQALKGLIKLTRKGHPTSVAVDGPRGPIYVPKPGVFEISKLAKAPIFALAMDSSSKWVSEKSWNKAVLPKPFSRIDVVIGEDFIPTLEKSDQPKDPKWASFLTQKINAAKQQASDLIQ